VLQKVVNHKLQIELTIDKAVDQSKPPSTRQATEAVARYNATIRANRRHNPVMDVADVTARIAAAIQAERTAQQATQQAAIDAAVAAALAGQPQPPPQVAQQAAIDAAVAAALAGQAPPPPPAVTFALAAGSNGQLIDYKSREGQKIAEGAKASLKPDFNLKDDDLHVFVTSVFDRGEEYGYNRDDGILDVPNTAGEKGNICIAYSMRTVAEVRAHAESYAFQQTRKAQDSVNLYQCLMNSLTPDAKATILQFQDEYTLVDPADSKRKLKSGALLFRIMVRESHIDTKFTSREVRLQLSSLDTFMIKCGSDLEVFTKHVNKLLMKLAAREETTEDLTANLLKAYKVCADTKFRAYIDRQEERIDDGEDIPPPLLMSRCLTKYQMSKQRDEWQAPTADEDKIIALQAQISKLLAMAATTTQEQQVKPSSEPRKGKRKAREAWMDIPIKDGEPTTKTVNGVEYRYCTLHKWCHHLTDTCKNIKRTAEKPPADAAKPAAKEGPTLVISQALKDLMAEE